MADPKTRDGWVQRLTVDGGSSAPSKTLYNCGAGATAFYVDPFANLSPCIMTPQYTYSLRDNSLQGIWDDEIAAMRAKPRTRSAGCSSAGATSMCTGCAALNYLETGDEETDSAYMRETTRLRHEAVLAAINEQEDMIHE